MSSCAICLEAELKVPAACVPCGHTFCLDCITRWTRSPPRFSVSLCPHCRAPVREVQKLFISDWPVTTGTQGPPSHLSPWQQFLQLGTLIMHFLSIPVHAAAQYGPEMMERASLWVHQQAERVVSLKFHLVRCAGRCVREWRELGVAGQAVMGTVVLLVALLLVQDIQAEDGIHRGVVLPVLLVLADIVRRVVAAAAYCLYRPMACLALCVAQVAVAGVDVLCVLGTALAWVAFDVACVPWLLACVAAKGVFAVLSAVAGVVRLVMFLLMVALLLGVPTLLASPQDQPLRAQLCELAQAAGRWLRLKLLAHSRQHLPPHPHPHHRPHHHHPFPIPPPDPAAAYQRGGEREEGVVGEGGEGGAPPPPPMRLNIVQDFFRLLSEELQQSAREEGVGLLGGRRDSREEGEEGDVGMGLLEGRRGSRDEGEEEESEGDGEEEGEGVDVWRNAVTPLSPRSFLHTGDGPGAR